LAVVLVVFILPFGSLVRASTGVNKRIRLEDEQSFFFVLFKLKGNKKKDVVAVQSLFIRSRQNKKKETKGKLRTYDMLSSLSQIEESKRKIK